MHSTAELFVGVFDYDGTDLNDHDGCGRITIDPSKFENKMEYVVTYNLYESKRNPSCRNPQGAITLRICVEYNVTNEKWKTVIRIRKMYKKSRCTIFLCQGFDRQGNCSTFTSHLRTNDSRLLY